MILDIWYILGHIGEFLLFLYYANTNFYPRKNYIQSSSIALCGYFILFAIGVWGNVIASIISFWIINIILLHYCYNLRLKSSVFYSLILDMLSIIGEYIIVGISDIDFNNLISMTSQQSMFLTIGGKLIYLIGIVFLKHFTNRKTSYENEIQITLSLIPILTILCLNIIIKRNVDDSVFLILCYIFVLINFIAFYINERLNEKNLELKILQEEYNQNKAELSEYQLLAEKYESTKIMRHDFHKQLSVLKDLIATDNVQAKEYMKQIQFSQRELDYTQYTDNKILNILFAQKVKECHERGVEIHIHSTSPTLSFISDIDTVAIFSNMIDNSIEAAEQAEKKEIFVDLYTVNDSYSAVKIENYTDKEPIILNGVLHTQKKNADMHGMGIKSINNALKKYKSKLTWSYDKENKFFRAIVLIHIP